MICNVCFRKKNKWCGMGMSESGLWALTENQTIHCTLWPYRQWLTQIFEYLKCKYYHHILIFKNYIHIHYFSSIWKYLMFIWSFVRYSNSRLSKSNFLKTQICLWTLSQKNFKPKMRKYIPKLTYNKRALIIHCSFTKSK